MYTVQVTLTQEVLTGLLEWVSEVHLRQYISEQVKTTKSPNCSIIQDKCVKVKKKKKTICVKF